MLKYLLPIIVLFLFFKLPRYGFLVCNFLFFLVISFRPMLVRPVTVDRVMIVDELRVRMVILSLWVSRLILLARDRIRNSRFVSFVGWVLILCYVLVVAFRSRGLMIFYIFFEASLIPVTVMVLGWGYQPERLQARGYLILYTVGARLPLLVRIFIIFLVNGHVSFRLKLWYAPVYYNIVFWWAVRIFAFIVKTPLYFVHLWLPKAHVEAPVAGSMILAGVLLKLGGFGLIRLCIMYQSVNVRVSCFFRSVATWGAVLCGLICLRQTDMKALIAYRSVTHMGVVVGGIMRNTVWG